MSFCLLVFVVVIVWTGFFRTRDLRLYAWHSGYLSFKIKRTMSAAQCLMQNGSLRIAEKRSMGSIDISWVSLVVLTQNEVFKYPVWHINFSMRKEDFVSSKCRRFLRNSLRIFHIWGCSLLSSLRSLCRLIMCGKKYSGLFWCCLQSFTLQGKILNLQDFHAVVDLACSLLGTYSWSPFCYNFWLAKHTKLEKDLFFVVFLIIAVPLNWSITCHYFLFFRYCLCRLFLLFVPKSRLWFGLLYTRTGKRIIIHDANSAKNPEEIFLQTRIVRTQF